MKRILSFLLSGMLIASSILFLGIAVAEGVFPGQVLAEETGQALAEESLGECFTDRVLDGEDLKECDLLLDSEREKFSSADSNKVQRCNALEDRVETNTPEYLRLYEVRDCNVAIEDSPFWSKIYYGDSDAACQYDSLYKEYVCE